MTATPTAPALKVAGLRKSSGSKVVPDGIDLEVGEGTVFSWLDPNGAGNPTTIQFAEASLRNYPEGQGIRRERERERERLTNAVDRVAGNRP